MRLRPISLFWKMTCAYLSLSHGDWITIGHYILGRDHIHWKNQKTQIKFSQSLAFSLSLSLPQSPLFLSTLSHSLSLSTLSLSSTPNPLSLAIVWISTVRPWMRELALTWLAEIALHFTAIYVSSRRVCDGAEPASKALITVIVTLLP